MKICGLLAVAVLLWSCASGQQVPQAPKQQAPEGGTPAQEPPQPIAAAGESNGAVTPTEEPAAVTPEGGFVVSEEVYTRTFDEIEEFIRNLNDIIHRRDYQSWLAYLSEEYIRRTSDREYLLEQSEKPLLKKSNIRLQSLQDYFEYVVAPSHSRAALEDIEFIDESRVKVISSIRGTRGILYLLVRQNGGWKIGIWD